MEEEFGPLMVKVLVSALVLFGLAAAALGFFFRGLGKESSGQKGANQSHAVRAAILIGILLLTCFYFVWLAYR